MVLIVALALSEAALQAQTARWWDNNGTTAGAGSGGTWSATGNTWTTISGGTGTPGAWVSGDRARFSAGTDLLDVPYTITVSGTINVSSIEPEEGAPLTITGGTLNLVASGTVTTPRILTVFGNANQSITINSVLAGTGGLDLRFAGGSVGTIVLGGANTYSGNTVINHGTGGILRNGANEVIPNGSDVQVGSSVTTHWELNNFTETINGLFGLSGSTVKLGSGTLIIGHGNDRIYPGTISGTGRVIKSGAGTQTFTGNNSYSGGTTLNAGVLQIGHNSALGTGTLTINAGTVRSSSSAARTLSVPVVLSGNVTLGGASPNNGNLTFQTGGWTISGGSRTITVDTILATISSAIGEDTAGRGLIKAGGGILRLSGANTYSGGTTLNAGVLEIGNNSALGTGTLTINAGTLRSDSSTARTLSVPVVLSGNVTLGGASPNNGNLTFQTGVWTISGGSRTITVDTILATISSAIGEDTAGRGLVKDGAGVLSLTGDNTYSGGTTINAGTLLVNNASGSGLGSGSVTVNNGGKLGGSGSFTGGLTLNSGATVSPGNSVGKLTTGAQTWSGGAGFVFEIKDVDLGEGLGWDFLEIDGALDITASSANNFTIDVRSLTLGDTSGAVNDWDPYSNYSWRFLTASGGIGFLPGEDETTVFELLLGDFTSYNSVPAEGSFSVTRSGNDLFLTYAVPEPGTGALVLLGAGLMALGRRRAG